MKKLTNTRQQHKIWKWHNNCCLLSQMVMTCFVFTSVHPAYCGLKWVRSWSIIQYGYYLVRDFKQVRFQNRPRCCGTAGEPCGGQSSRTHVDHVTAPRETFSWLKPASLLLFIALETVQHMNALWVYCSLASWRVPTYAPLTSPSASRCHFKPR